MADAAEGDAFVLNLSLVIPAVIALIPGLVIHSFIIGVNVNDWWKGRSVTSVDHIVTSLGSSRMCSQCALMLYFFLATFFLNRLVLDIAERIVSRLYVFFFYSNIWLTSLRSIIFCLKISNLRTRLFLYLKKMVVQRTVHVIVTLLLLCAITSLMHMLIVNNMIPSGEICNTTMDNHLTNYNYIFPSYSFIIGSFIPLLFYFISSVLLFTSLYQHLTRMKEFRNLSINLGTYYSAMKFVSFTFIYNTIYFNGHCACALYHYIYQVELTWPYITLDFLPVLHSSYLIYRTAKLRSQMSKVLQNVIDFILERKNTETREKIEVVGQ